MKTCHLIFAAMVALGVRAGVRAGEVVADSNDRHVSLVELFTSEGCSSCPAAETWMSGLKGHPGLWKEFVPVAFHVDYWDRLGWPDRFATAVNTARQRAYAAAWKSSSVYTPGFVVNGRENRGGRPSVGAGSGAPGRLRVEKAGEKTYAVVFEPTVNFGGGVAQLALLGFGEVSDVQRGENAGRKLRHDFVVTWFATARLSEKEGSWRAEFDVPRAEGAWGVAAWVGDGASPAPIQAAGGWGP